MTEGLADPARDYLKAAREWMSEALRLASENVELAHRLRVAEEQAHSRGLALQRHLFHCLTPLDNPSPESGSPADRAARDRAIADLASDG